MLIHGDCLEEMQKMADNSIDAICTDPPYGISFMGKGWDKGIPSTEYWQEMLRILKPGGHLLAAGLPRMMHRLICVIEDAGFEIRDQIMHLFGSGFPKSHNFGKKLGAEWEGYGTALKPAWEGWCLAMKPINGTFIQNAEKWGIGGLNIDESRIFRDDESGWSKSGSKESENKSMRGENYAKEPKTDNPNGRWPSNLILSEEAAAELDRQSGVLKSGYIRASIDHESKNKVYSKRNSANINEFEENSGGASRYFYCAKACPSERGGSTHPTMKPLKLMKYLLKLIMPPSKEAIVLDPFMGSGTTCLAAKELGMRFIGIEKESEYFEIAKKRIEAFKDDKQLTFF